MLKLLKTKDESYTLYNEALNETYHSKHGAVQESRYVFIQYGLLPLLGQKDPLRILEVGFGTGLNALLTLLRFEQTPGNIVYTGIEPFPLNKELVNAINYRDALQLTDEQYAAYLAMQEGNTSYQKEAFSFTFGLVKQEFLQCTPGPVDLIYFDAFAPDKQPEMWDEKTFARCYSLLSANGILVTYCAKGEVKRTLKACGFRVETLPGPPGKREMIRAIKPA